MKMNTLGVEGESLEIITERQPSDNELLMNERRPSSEYVAKSNGDGTGFWFQSSDVFSERERIWQQSQLTKTSTAIVHYESDAKIPDIYSELRVTNYTEDDYYALLGDRKLLVEYLEQQDFPECGRPKLSGLVPG
ncbi:hypothetical protein [Aliivibrio sp. EL58]|uniref:hypothetical protein n=1 Tax=Aliivibrio sp. EL58 TaxID=2107582 RepID=UPI000EFD1E3D|nr:hypothetical protein [Aliivibrio sp. EL58]